MKKACYLSVVFFILLFAIVAPVAAAPSVVLDGHSLTFDVAPVIENGRTLVPMRAIFEALGSTVLWDGYTSTITATKGNTTVRLQVGNNTALKNDQQIILEVPPKIINSRTLVPLRFVGESLGAVVNWDGANNQVIITSGNPISAPKMLYEPSELFQKCDPAILSIYVFDQNNTLMGSGSGIIVESTGKIVTNYHVIDGAYSAEVKLADGREIDVLKVLNYDIDKDIAVLQINATNLPFVTMGDSNNITNGEKVVAIGSPFGLENTITDGLISSTNRLIDGKQIIQVSTPISPGSSGGALINYSAQVIGITSSGLNKGQNINFAIPINEVKPLLTTNIDKTLTTLASLTNPVSSSPPKFSYSVMCEGVDEQNLSPITPTNIFSSNANKIYFFTTLDKPLNGSMTCNWYYLGTGEKQLVSTFTNISQDGDVFWFWYDTNGVSLPSGHWVLEAIMGNEIITIDFFVNNVNPVSQITNITSMEEREFNYTRDTANFIQLGQFAHGTLTFKDLDYYKISVNSYGTLWVGGSNIGSSNMNLAFELQDSNGESLKWSTKTNTGVREIKYYVTPGIYYICVLDANLGSGEGYTIMADML